MIVEKTIIPEVLVITPRTFEDKRGFFMETWNDTRLAVKWPLKKSASPILSAQYQRGTSFEMADPYE